MVRTTCAVRGCKSSYHFNKGLKFHQFPHSEERCKLWASASGRDDLIGRSPESLRHKHICGLHFLESMYGKQHLKKKAFPVINLPTPDHGPADNGPSTKKTTTIQNKKVQQTKEMSAQTDPTPQKRKLLKNRSSQRKKLKLSNEENNITEGSSQSKKLELSNEENNITEGSSQSKKLKLSNEENNITEGSSQNKKLKLSNEENDITEEIFLKGCDKFLSPQLAAIVKTHLRLKKGSQSPNTLQK